MSKIRGGKGNRRMSGIPHGNGNETYGHTIADCIRAGLTGLNLQFCVRGILHSQGQTQIQSATGGSSIGGNNNYVMGGIIECQLNCGETNIDGSTTYNGPCMHSCVDNIINPT